MAPRPCLGCGTPTTNGTRCKRCQRPVDQRKWARNPNKDPAYRKIMREVTAALPLPCSLCPRPITHTGTDRDALTLDHIVPTSHGGTNDRHNLRPTHRGCNSARGNRP